MLLIHPYILINTPRFVFDINNIFYSYGKWKKSNSCLFKHFCIYQWSFFLLPLICCIFELNSCDGDDDKPVEFFDFESCECCDFLWKHCGVWKLLIRHFSRPTNLIKIKCQQIMLLPLSWKQKFCPIRNGVVFFFCRIWLNLNMHGSSVDSVKLYWIIWIIYKNHERILGGLNAHLF